MLPLIRPDLAQLSAYKVDTSLLKDLPIDKLDANEAGWDLPEFFKAKLGAIAHTHTEANRYPDGEYLRLKQLVAEYVDVDNILPSQITLGNGSDEIIRSLLTVACLHKGGILVAEPTFSMYGILAKTLGIPIVSVPRDPSTFQIDLNAANQAIAAQNIAAIFLVHPNSPTGNLLTDKELDWVRSLPENILVVIDEAYYEFSGSTLVGELAQHPNWMILRTFSKAFRLAAYRVGYGIGGEALIDALEKVRLPYNLPSVSYLAAELAMTHRQELLDIVPQIQQERDRLLAQIRQMGIKVWSSAGNFLYAKTDDDNQLRDRLKTKGTLIRQTGGGLRITVGTPEQNQRLIERLKDCLS